MRAELVLPGLAEEIRLAVREEVQRALQMGGAGGYLNVDSAALYLDTTKDAIKSMVRDGKIEPVRRQPRLLFTRDELDRWVREEAA